MEKQLEMQKQLEMEKQLGMEKQLEMGKQLGTKMIVKRRQYLDLMPRMRSRNLDDTLAIDD